MKRLHDTDIWEQDWFVDLPNEYKLLWYYIKDKCDNAGVWRPNKSIIQSIVGKRLSMDEFLQMVNADKSNRIVVLPNGRWWLSEFFFFQYGNKFNPNSNVHKGALKILASNSIGLNQVPKLICENLENATSKSQEPENEPVTQIGYPYPSDSLSEGYEKAIDSIKDKDKNKYIESNYSRVDSDIGELRTLTSLKERFFPKTHKELDPEKTELIMLIPEMMNVWNQAYPDYPCTQEVDYHALLNIAYAIASRKNWKKDEVIKERKKDCIESWKKVVEFLQLPTTPDFFKRLTIDSIANPKIFQKIEMEMRVPRKPINGHGNDQLAKQRREEQEKNRIEY